MKALKIIGIVILAIIVIVLAGALFMPGTTNIERSVMIKAPVSQVFEQVNCFKNWEKWSPWFKPETKYVYEGPECGSGSVMKWEDETMGNGTQTIVESIQDKLIQCDLDFGKGDVAKSAWIFEVLGDSVKVTWTLDSPAPYPIGRWIGVLMVKPMVGKDYVKGLNSLKEYVMTLPSPEPQNTLPGKTGEIVEKTVNTQPVLTITESVEYTKIGEAMGRMFGEVMAYIKKNNIKITGYPFAAYPDWDTTKLIKMEAGIPIEKPVKAFGKVKMSQIPGGKVVMAIHYGAYETSNITHEAINKYIEEKKLVMNGAVYEVYVTDPQQEPDQSKWITEIYYPVK